MIEQLIDYIKTLVPLCDIKKEKNRKDLLKHILLGKMPADKILFHSGEKNKFTFYLLSGHITLIDEQDNQTILKSDDPRCRFPVGYDHSNRYTVKTNTFINYIKIDSHTLDVLLTWDQTTTPLLREPAKAKVNIDKDKWMSKILEQELFHRIPPSNIQAMFLRFEHIRADKDEVVIKQGSEADYYYVIQTGKAAVYRSSTEDDAQPSKLADLEAGQSFGEEALVSDSLRNATVIMQEPGELARLAKADFIELLKKPVVQSVPYPEALDLIAKGAQFIDVRTENEYQHNHLSDSLNIPLYSVRDKLVALDIMQQYVIYCDTGSRSAAATYILNQHGYSAILLDLGLNGVPSEAIEHPDKN